MLLEPTIRNPWHPPYYQQRLEEAGLMKAMDVFHWQLHISDREERMLPILPQLAERAQKAKIHLTMMGVGLDWKANLIKDLAKISEGKWYYIDVNQAMEAERIFVEEMEQLAATAFMNVEMHVRPMKDIKIKRVRQVVPEIKEYTLKEPEERHQVAELGTLNKDASTRYVLDLSLPKRPDGKYVICPKNGGYFGAHDNAFQVITPDLTVNCVEA